MSYLKDHIKRITPQWAPIPGSTQTRNSDSGYSWAVDDWTRLTRFLVLGSEGGSFYAGERKLTGENATAVERCIAADGERAVAEIVKVSASGRAPKNEPAIFALAMAAGAADERTRKAALGALPQVCRTGTHLFQFAQLVEGFRGWGRALRRAVGRWYAAQDVDALAYQAVKYRRREDMTHRDVLRLAHPARSVSAGNPTLGEVSDAHARLFDWVVRGGSADGLPAIVEGFAKAQSAETPARSAQLIREYRLPREAVRPEHLGAAEVWDALLEEMPMTALLSNLATMTRAGAIAPGSAGARRAVEQLGDVDRIRRARVHPIAVLTALRTYAAGRGVRGRGTWAPVAQVVDALDAAFYAAFGNVEPTGGRVMLALDVSGSMSFGEVAGAPGLTPRDASAAMALVTAASEARHEVVGFHAGGRRGRAGRYGPSGITPLAITPRQRLDDAVRAVSDLPFGATDCALPMLHAMERKREVDVFVIYTDSETWAGEIHPAQALREYRRRSGIDARLVVVGMVSNGFTIADPDDRGMLDVAGFDAATPGLISSFARGEM